MTWGEAYEYCWNLNARLLEFDTELQMKELNLIIENESVKHNNWIGATDFGSEGTFKWIESGQDVGNFSWHPGAGLNIQGEPKKSGISKSMYIALRAIKIKQIKF